MFKCIQWKLNKCTYFVWYFNRLNGLLNNGLINRIVTYYLLTFGNLLSEILFENIPTFKFVNPSLFTLGKVSLDVYEHIMCKPCWFLIEIYISCLWKLFFPIIPCWRLKEPTTDCKITVAVGWVKFLEIQGKTNKRDYYMQLLLFYYVSNTFLHAIYGNNLINYVFFN